MSRIRNIYAISIPNKYGLEPEQCKSLLNECLRICKKYHYELLDLSEEALKEVMERKNPMFMFGEVTAVNDRIRGYFKLRKLSRRLYSEVKKHIAEIAAKMPESCSFPETFGYNPHEIAHFYAKRAQGWLLLHESPIAFVKPIIIKNKLLDRVLFLILVSTFVTVSVTYLFKWLKKKLTKTNKKPILLAN
jgi:hypothetical protein